MQSRRKLGQYGERQAAQLPLDAAVTQRGVVVSPKWQPRDGAVGLSLPGPWEAKLDVWPGGTALFFKARALT